MKNSRESMLTNEPVGGLIWRLSIPAMVAMFVNGLYNLVDTIYIGHGVGSMGIAGLSIAFPIQMLIGGMGFMLGSALIILIVPLWLVHLPVVMPSSPMQGKCR